MKLIALAAVAGVILLQVSGAVPDSSVGGPMTLVFAFMLAALAAGIHEAWTMKRGVIGWIVSIFTALVGAIVAGLVVGSLVDTVMAVAAQALDLQGSLAETKHPLLYILSAAMMLLMLFGSWLALQIVNRMR
jgi:hypothetical protein